MLVIINGSLMWHALHKIIVRGSLKVPFIIMSAIATIKSNCIVIIFSKSNSYNFVMGVFSFLPFLRIFQVNRLLVLKMGPEAQGLGYDFVIRDVEENCMIGSLCDLVERVWNHGLIIREGKSALWTTLRRHFDKWKTQHHHTSPCTLHYCFEIELTNIYTLYSIYAI